MPFALGPLIAGGLAGVGGIFAAPIIGSLTVGGLLSGVLATGIMFGIQMLLNQGPKGTEQRSQVTAKEPTPRRLRGYGQMKLGGSTVFLEADGVNMHTATVHCEGPIDSIQEVWLDDTLTAFPAGRPDGRNSTAPWNEHVGIECHLGERDQGASGILTFNYPWWTDHHRLRGLAYTVQHNLLPKKAYKTFQKVFPTGAPGLRVVARLSKVHDPRGGTDWNDPATWTYSDNASRCILDFLTHERVDAITGRAWRFIPKSRINVASWATFADICDQPVTLKAGGTEPRYRLSGVYDLSEEPRDVLKRMLATCDAELISFPDGTVGIKGGVWEEPEITITDKDVISFRYEQGNDKLSAFNRLKWTFTDRANDYQIIEGDPWDDEPAQIETGEILTENMDLPMVFSHAQGRRLAKVYTAKANPRHKFTSLVVKMPALALVQERVVRLTLAYLGIDAVFVITRFEPSGDLVTATLDLHSLDPNTYEWNGAAEEGTAPPVQAGGSADIETPTPSGVALNIVTTALSDDISALRIRVTAAPPTGDYADYWTLSGRYREQGTTDWSDMISDGDDAAISGTVSTGLTYEVEVSYQGLNVDAVWTSAGTIEATV